MSDHAGFRHNDESHNREVERLANLMLHDGVSVDEQSPAALDAYVRQVDLSNCNIPYDAENRDDLARSLVYEALLYRKMKSAGSGDDNILDRGSNFGAGFS